MTLKERKKKERKKNPTKSVSRFSFESFKKVLPPFFLKELLNSFIVRSLLEGSFLFRYNIVLGDFVTINNSVRHVDGVVLLSVF